jgi:RimJ/RimL family protein N-acetyltransferase
MIEPIRSSRLRLREASRDDLDAVSDLLAGTPRALACSAPFRTDVAPAALDQVVQAALHSRDRQFLLLEEVARESAVMGLLDIRLHHPWARSAFIELLLLAPGARGRGFGREACEAWHRWAVGGRDLVEVQASVLAEDAGALSFWRALGYRETGLRRRDETGRTCLTLIRPLE